ncbi:hypothetical protein KP509_38G035300 [Ceratopteris richardii]|uniref:Uncharacterized protein n=1 Tax=Ceratopteris richardii TaxID=49495 RepID=A0A8T2Q2X2_CERRI|nr:hypothetical protein KP509_38G035300 [Ceratopteris richardii]
MDMLNTSDDGSVTDGEDDESCNSKQSPSGHSFEVLQRRLEAERNARKAAETEMDGLRVSFSRLKSITAEAVQQRDHMLRLKDEAESSQQDLLRKLNEALNCRDDAIRQRDEALKSRDNAIRSRDEISLLRDVAMHARNSTKLDVESAVRILVAGAGNITDRVQSVQSFDETLPRSSSHTGIAAIAYGFTKRAETIIDGLLLHSDRADKDLSSLRQQMEQQQYQSAFKIEKLEATIQRLEDRVASQITELGKWKSLAAENEQKLCKFEQMLSEKISTAEDKTRLLMNDLNFKDITLKKLDGSIQELALLLSESHATLAKHAIEFLPTDTLIEKIPPPSNGAKADKITSYCTDRLKVIMNLFLKLAIAWKEQTDLRRKALEDLENTITRLIVEKKEITSFLQIAITRKQEVLEAVSKVSLGSEHNLNTMAKKSGDIGSFVGQYEPLNNNLHIEDPSREGSIWETELKQSKQEMFELQQSLAVARFFPTCFLLPFPSYSLPFLRLLLHSVLVVSCRGELEMLRTMSEYKAKELLDKMIKIKDFENEQYHAQNTIDDLKSRLAAASDALEEFKEAAAKEAGESLIRTQEVEQLKEQVSFWKHQSDKLNDLLEETKGKLLLKEEMAAAAVAARKAAEQSLRIADGRALQLHKKIDELIKQFELLEGKDDGITPSGWYDACWPSQWLWGRPSHLCNNGFQKTDSEMEKLKERLIRETIHRTS